MPLFLATAPFIPIGQAVLTSYILNRYVDCEDMLVDAAQEFLNCVLGKDATDQFIKDIDIYL